MNNTSERGLLAGSVLLTMALVALSQGRDLGDAPPVVEVASLPREARIARDTPGDLTHPPTVPDSAWATLAGGLRVADLEPGSGPTAGYGDTAAVDYALWTAAGALIDQSWARPDPFSFRPGARQVIAGWDQAMDGLRVGGRRLVQIPAALGFGRAGTAGVAPDTDLILELRLVAVTAPRTAPPAPNLQAIGPLAGDLIGADVQVGAGAQPAAQGQVRIDYVAMRQDGSVIASTWARPKSAWFALDSLPAPLPTAIAGMRVGGRRVVKVPSELIAGLGSLGAGVPEGEPVFLDITLQEAPPN